MPRTTNATEAAPGKTTKTYRAVVIGRTGGGDYGHGYDRVFAGLDNVTVEAVADIDPEGRKKAAASSGAKRQYADYKEMLVKEKADLVSIAPRQPDCHLEMGLAAIDAGTHIFMEKPMTETVTEADRILDAAARKRVRIVVAHSRRYTSSFVQVKALLQQGLVGTVLDVHIRGKQDGRAGGEDLIVLGTHDFDLLRFYFGDPQWCMASVTQNGRDVTREDVRKGNEPILVAGNTVHALFAFPNNIMVHWSSIKTSDHWNTNFSKREKWTFQIHGTKGVLTFQPGLEWVWLDSPFLAHKDDAGRWKELPPPAQNTPVPEHAAHPIRDLIHAIESGEPPVCSGYDGRWAIEMVAAVHESHRIRGRIGLPLPAGSRENPLLRL